MLATLDQRGSIAAYPLTYAELCALRPGMSMPKRYTPETLRAVAAVIVVQTQQPEHDPETQIVVELAPQKINGIWQQRFDVHSINEPST